MSDVKSKVRKYVLGSLQGAQLDDSADIFASGLAHSLFAMHIVLFLEKEFGIELELDRVGLTSFSSIDAISALVEQVQPLQASGMR